MSDTPPQEMLTSAPIRKLRYGVGVGVPSGGGLAIVLAYLLGRLDPQMPPDIRVLAAGLLASALAGAGAWLVAYYVSPAAQDQVVPSGAPKADPPGGIP